MCTVKTLSESTIPLTEVINSVPEHQRHHMISGMRWTLWLSILSAPCGYVTTVLLARVDPAVIATYGLMSLYVGLTSMFLFFGGNGVAIKFLPEVPAQKRLSFLISYFLVILDSRSDVALSDRSVDLAQGVAVCTGKRSWQLVRHPSRVARPSLYSLVSGPRGSEELAGNQMAPSIQPHYYPDEFCAVRRIVFWRARILGFSLREQCSVPE
jgi:hypothetical protein